MAHAYARCCGDINGGVYEVIPNEVHLQSLKDDPTNVDVGAHTKVNTKAPVRRPSAPEEAWRDGVPTHYTPLKGDVNTEPGTKQL
jgi:hypothetical protein